MQCMCVSINEGSNLNEGVPSLWKSSKNLFPVSSTIIQQSFAKHFVGCYTVGSTEMSPVSYLVQISMRASEMAFVKLGWGKPEV